MTWSATVRVAQFLCFAAALHGAKPSWLDRVSPVITPSEKKAWLALKGEERAKFEEDFWAKKAISGEEYFQRVEYIDTMFGSGKPGSGANTDQGTVYLSLGAPTKITRLPSSRIFVPIEIWYYDVVPDLLNTELRLIFYQKNSMGFPKLYSPTLDTIRALLLPEAATVHAFGPDDSLPESTIRQVLNVPPAEDEVITAAVNVATGIKYTGNDEILGQITSPQKMLGRPRRTEVTSRMITSPAKLEVLQTRSDYGGSQIDLRLETEAARELNLEILEGGLAVYQDRLHLKFAKAEPVVYTHRIDLLPGSYRVHFTVDGRPIPFALEVPEHTGMSDIVRADSSDASGNRQTPFQFDGKQFDLNPNGKYAVLAFDEPQSVTWRIRHGSEVVWRSVSEPARFVLVALPAGLPAGTYMIEAVTPSDSRSSELIIRHDTEPASSAAIVSYNANLAPATRFAFLGHQWLLRGKAGEARRALQASLEKGITDGAQIELARLDAFDGHLDSARDRARAVLKRNAENFEALSVLAYVETGFQDYAIAAQLYRKALAIQDSPSVRAALAEVARLERIN